MTGDGNKAKDEGEPEKKLLSAACGKLNSAEINNQTMKLHKELLRISALKKSPRRKDAV